MFRYKRSYKFRNQITNKINSTNVNNHQLDIYEAM